MVQSVADPCGNSRPMVFKHKITGEVLSPNYPAQYPNNADCQWRIIVDAGFVVQLNFLEFDVEDG